MCNLCMLIGVYGAWHVLRDPFTRSRSHRKHLGCLLYRVSIIVFVPKQAAAAPIDAKLQGSSITQYVILTLCGISPSGLPYPSSMPDHQHDAPHE